MFCKKCGKELKFDASFCDSCGTPVGEAGQSAVESTRNAKDTKEDNVVRIEIKPTFVVGYQILLLIKNILIALLVVIYAFEADFVYFMPVLLPIIIIACVIKLLIDKAQYKKMSYRFLKTKVEYTDSFLNKEEKQLKYEHIREVTMSQNIFERLFHIGRIRLVTAANNNRYMKNGVDIRCVTDIEEKIKKVREIMDEADES